MATSITTAQSKQFKRFAEDAVERCMDALDEVGLDKAELQRVLERGGEFQALVVEGLRRLSAPTPSKFELVKDLGIIEIPADYTHAHLDRFVEANRKQFYFMNEDITDVNYSEKATTKLTPNRKIRVKVYRQTVGGSTTSVERMDFLRQQKGNLFLGAQGVTLVWPKRQELPKGKWYCSFDEQAALWQGAHGRHRVPGLGCGTDGDFGFNLGYFERDWNDGGCLLGFSDVSAEAESEGGL